MRSAPDNWLATRATLLSRLKDWEDGASWEEFFTTYGRLIYQVVRKSGLAEAEAQDVVQDTVITVAKHLRDFRYDKSKGTFKSWLLAITRSRMIDRYRRAKREKTAAPPPPATTSETSLLERYPDPTTLNPDALWEREWNQNLLEAADANVRKRVDSKHYQVFDCFVRQELPAAAVAARLNIKPEQVYVIKQRIAALLRQEIERLEIELV